MSFFFLAFGMFFSVVIKRWIQGHSTLLGHFLPTQSTWKIFLCESCILAAISSYNPPILKYHRETPWSDIVHLLCRTNSAPLYFGDLVLRLQEEFLYYFFGYFLAWNIFFPHLINSISWMLDLLDEALIKKKKYSWYSLGVFCLNF